MNLDDVIQPTVYVIAGPNGAGKTTFATEYLPHFVDCREFLNADLIAAGLAPFAPETQNARAGRLLLERIQELSVAKTSFAFETTLSGRTYAHLLGTLKEQGYRVELYFLWLPSADMAVARVQWRVKQGGHSVPDSDVRRRYLSGKRNLFQLYRDIVDAWWMYDSSKKSPLLIASEENSLLSVLQPELYCQIEKSLEI